jgi:hypothetical protein
MKILNERNLKAKGSAPVTLIDWEAVDRAPLADVPDDETPELTATQATELRPLFEVLPLDG